MRELWSLFIGYTTELTDELNLGPYSVNLCQYQNIGLNLLIYEIDSDFYTRPKYMCGHFGTGMHKNWAQMMHVRKESTNNRRLRMRSSLVGF